ncbi:hypothetical protein BaRGS_00037394 [Batillaria attramentaria]|uniref:Cadherin domain-containing protein n=1 Tax=Batillaria attramentaria TaxID=370345 RepID=A0ABD0J8Y9_9CAEN
MHWTATALLLAMIAPHAADGACSPSVATTPSFNCDPCFTHPNRDCDNHPNTQCQTDGCCDNTTAAPNVAPVITSLPASVDLSEDTSSSMLLHTIATNDTNGDDVSCYICSTTPSGGPFFIKITGPSPVEYSLHLTAFPGLNYTEASVHEVEITCDDGLLADNKIFYIYVLVNGMPAILNLQTGAILLTATPAEYGYDLDITASDGFHTTAAHRLTVLVTALQVSIATGQSMDYETVTQYVLNMTVSDDSDTSDWGLLTVEVADVNEQPQLLKNSYSVVQDEGLVGTSFNAPAMDVTDPDTGDSHTFSMDSASDSSCSYISVNSSTGIMNYGANYDVDDTSLAQLFTCLVQDSGGLSVTATVTVSIQDLNDNHPAFASTSYVFTVSQSASVGIYIGTVSASDSDVSTVYSDLTFTLDQSSLTLTYFSVDSGGRLTLAASVATLAVDTTLTFKALVENSATSGSSDTATVYVTITEDDSDGFWDSGANIAWVTLMLVLLAAMMAAAAYMFWRFWPGCRETAGGSRL